MQERIARPPEAKLTLAIEISNPSAGGRGAGPGVALRDVAAGWTDVEPLGQSRSVAAGLPRAGHGGNDDDLMPAIERLFARRTVIASDVGLVMVSVGPGGYTGLRIACAVGKMIAVAAGAKCMAAPTAMVVARRVDGGAWERGGGGGVAVALASKGETAWVQRAERDGRVDVGSVVDARGIEKMVGAGVKTLVADRFLPASMRAAAALNRIEIVEPVFDPAAMFELVGLLPEIDPVELVPLYPREPDAVTLWRAKKR